MVIDVDSPPEDTIAMISNNHPDIIFVPLNKSQEPSLEELPIFLDTAADVERRANREPDLDYSPEFIVVPLGLSENDTQVEVDQAEDKPKNCKVASAMENLQNEANEARKLRKYIWEYPGCENTYEYFSYLLDLGM